MISESPISSCLEGKAGLGIHLGTANAQFGTVRYMLCKLEILGINLEKSGKSSTLPLDFCDSLILVIANEGFLENREKQVLSPMCETRRHACLGG